MRRVSFRGGVTSLIAVVLLASGVAKLLGPPEADQALASIISGIGEVQSQEGLFVAVAVLEVGLAGALIMGLVVGRAQGPILYLTTGLLALFCLYHVYALVTGQTARSCQCFGKELRLHHSVVMITTAVLTGLAAAASALTPGHSARGP